MPADGASYDSLTVSITDNASRPAVTKAPVAVFLTSSRPDLVSVQQAVTIPANSSFVTVPVSTSLAAGQAYITASAVNFTSSSLPVTTVSIPPTELGMYVADASGLITPTADALNFVVQLQDSQGLPAEARTSASVIVSFSNTTLLSSPIDLVIPRGTDLVYGSVPLARATEGTFTAISNGLFSASVQFAAAPLGVTASIGPSANTIYPNQTAYVYYSIQYQGHPAAGAALTWTATGGTIKPGSPTTDAAGTASVTTAHSGLAAFAGKRIVLGLRPEHLPASGDARPGPTLTGDVDLVEALGSELMVHFTIDAKRVQAEGAHDPDAEDVAAAGEGVARVDPRAPVKAGERFTFAIDADGMQF
ncbi:MAG: TOBE domain-containing protein, partial [Nitrososphaerota archaeon]|nr:TOBE domain-containing protein [Nitrososphaerota archaeon]